METTKLEMEFLDAGNKKFTIRLDDPRVDITDEEVATVMASILTHNIFTSNALDLVSASEARTVTTTINPITI